MGRLLEYVLAHEVGHTLGYQHNMKASSMYPLDSIRSPSWVHTMGHTPSIMDYARMNYVAQPGGSHSARRSDPACGTVRHLGHALGLRRLIAAATPLDERPTLDKWARDQDTKPWLRFSTSGNQSADPGDETEAVGDADAVRATELGIKNLKRVRCR